MTFLSLCDIIFSQNERNERGANLRAYLKELRKKAGLTQNDVAERIGIGASTYTMIELGERQKDMNLSLVEKLAEVFGVSVGEIAEEEAKLKK